MKIIKQTVDGVDVYKCVQKITRNYYKTVDGVRTSATASDYDFYEDVTTYNGVDLDYTNVS